ncbi:SDR family oxidoreductase [Saccharopolyspora spinosa]|uniref:SDR family oxidoreductase n=1 Tax=Saccharopolyspora spinosa TaxID=60894 RepID=UPI000237B778|nr:SDR family oxidoreductase [Saccharopolyspora spinosa]
MQRFAQEDAAVAFLDFDASSRTGHSHAYDCDVTDFAAVETEIDRIAADLARVDIFVNNTGEDASYVSGQTLYINGGTR